MSSSNSPHFDVVDEGDVEPAGYFALDPVAGCFDGDEGYAKAPVPVAPDPSHGSNQPINCLQCGDADCTVEIVTGVPDEEKRLDIVQDFFIKKSLFCFQGSY